MLFFFHAYDIQDTCLECRKLDGLNKPALPVHKPRFANPPSAAILSRPAMLAASCVIATLVQAAPPDAPRAVADIDY